MEHWENIRLRCVRDGESKKCVARDLGISPNTVRKYCARMEAPQPPRYERRCKLDPFVKVIDALIESTPKITAKRIGSIIRQRYDSTLTISEAALRKYVARRRRELVPKEAFVRAQHVPADQAQFDSRRWRSSSPACSWSCTSLRCGSATAERSLLAHR